MPSLRQSSAMLFSLRKPFQHDANLLFRREVLPGGAADVPDGLLQALRSLLVSLSLRVPPRAYDEPQTLSYAITSKCPIGPDGGQQLFVTRTGKVQGRLGPGLKTFRCELAAALHAFSMGAVLDSCQRSLYRGDLAGDEYGLPFQRLIVLHLDRSFGGAAT